MGRVYAVRPENAGERVLRGVRVLVKDIGNEWTEFRCVTRVAFDLDTDEGSAHVTFLPENSDRRPRSANSVALYVARATVYVTAKLEPLIGCPVPKADEPAPATEAIPTNLRAFRFQLDQRVYRTTSQHSEPGRIRSMFLADDGSPRYVFQYDQPKGNLFITNESQLSLERKPLPSHNS